MQANVLPFYTPLIPIWGQKVIPFFSDGQITRKDVLNIMHLKCLTLCTPLAFWVGLKGLTLKLTDEYLISFGYNLSDTQDGLRFWRNEIYILW